ncbi:MAG: hypothetical protein ACLQDC_00085, partial [Verrucomicrobiia bacterium]
RDEYWRRSCVVQTNRLKREHRDVNTASSWKVPLHFVRFKPVLKCATRQHQRDYTTKMRWGNDGFDGVEAI